MKRCLLPLQGLNWKIFPSPSFKITYAWWHAITLQVPQDTEGPEENIDLSLPPPPEKKEKVTTSDESSHVRLLPPTKYITSSTR